MADQEIEGEVKFDPAIQSEDIAFKASEMVACDRCSRSNPPTRTTCLYCGNALNVVVSTEHLGTAFRRLEPDERGWNVIAADLTESNIAAIGELLRMAPDHVRSIAEAGCPIPIARVESQKVAEHLRDELNGCGAAARIISDEDLRINTPPLRLRRIDLNPDGPVFTDFNTSKTIDTAWTDLALMVSGQLISTRTDSVEKRRRRNKDVATLDSSESSRDEYVVDIYTHSDPQGYRVNASGFDFSTLGAEKTMFAGRNLEALVSEMCKRAPNLRHVDDYRAVLQLLDDVWERESRQDPQGLIRVGFGKKEFGRRYSANNALQFLKYSRLQWHLL